MVNYCTTLLTKQPNSKTIQTILGFYTHDNYTFSLLILSTNCI